MYNELCIYYISVIFLYDFSLQYGKRQYDCRGVHDMSLDENKCYIELLFYIRPLFNAAVRDIDV